MPTPVASRRLGNAPVRRAPFAVRHRTIPAGDNLGSSELPETAKLALGVLVCGTR